MRGLRLQGLGVGLGTGFPGGSVELTLCRAPTTRCFKSDAAIELPTNMFAGAAKGIHAAVASCAKSSPHTTLSPALCQEMLAGGDS